MLQVLDRIFNNIFGNRSRSLSSGKQMATHVKAVAAVVVSARTVLSAISLPEFAAAAPVKFPAAPRKGSPRSKEHKQ